MARVFLSLALLSTIGCVNAKVEANELVLSKDISLHYQQPEVIAHSWQLLTFKYRDWSFSHEIVNPKTMYSGIDLTGLLQNYIRSMFESEALSKLPAGWLQELSKEQASVHGITEESSDKIKAQFGTLYYVYDKDSSEGQIYILEENQTHRIQVGSNREQFQQLISNIRER